MTEARTIGEAQNYDELQPILRQRADALGMSRAEIDRIAGFPEGFSAHALAPVPDKRLGPDTIGPMCWALGVKFVVVESQRAMELFTAQADKRNEHQAQRVLMHSNTVHIKISGRKLKRAQRKGGVNSRKFVSRKTARKLARKAACARWEQVRIRAERAAAARVARALEAAAQPSVLPQP